MKDWHSDLLYACAIPGCYPSEGAKWYTDRGKDIPDFLLPGRFVQKLSLEERTSLVNVLEKSKPSNWWCKILCG